MANKQIFTAFDVYGFKKALAYHAAKQNFLVEKWTKYRDALLGDCQIRQIYDEIISDLQAPADSFLSDFEMRNCKHG